jgi:hypothetical protein
MMSWLSAKPWSDTSRDATDIEQTVADWTDRQELTGWVPSAIVLGLLLASIILLALGRAA